MLFYLSKIDWGANILFLNEYTVLLFVQFSFLFLRYLQEIDLFVGNRYL